MQLNIDKIAEKVGVAARFDWTWTEADLAAFCAAEGWRVDERDELGVILATDLEVDRSRARWHSEGTRVNWVSVWVLDGTAQDRADVARRYDGFVDIMSAIEPILGTPSRRTPGADGDVRWDIANVVVRLRLSTNGISLAFVSPEHQAWLDAPDDEEF